MPKNVTIYDIAKASGCSPATVSLALNNDERVKKETAIKIQQMAAELDYRPSYFGRSLITGKSKTIKVVLPDIHNPVLSIFWTVSNPISVRPSITWYWKLPTTIRPRKSGALRVF